ncbi:hypothetical protein EZV62_002881 [Acer yangbiense]|uniref:Protein kinase domain-containing protein n=1 Tax=Acer yangbiense TaxID=1000413 RepID=A0A5C7J0E1_9ROSI|nr:hypothetical protein EZV62_002881 [Acer yangbiense]
MESPADRMEMTDVVAKLCVIKENFFQQSNVLLDHDMVALVSDFGLAKYLLEELLDSLKLNSIKLYGNNRKLGAGINNVENSARQGEGRGRIEECLVLLC